MTRIDVSPPAVTGGPCELPSPTELDAETKRQVMAALRLILARLQEGGRFRGDVDYQAVVGSPTLLFECIQAYKADVATFQDIVVDAAGDPVAEPTTPLTCGPSLAQICQLLVYTCAKRQFAAVDSGKQPPDRPVLDKLASLLGRKSAAPEPSDDEAKLAALKNVLVFDWQLPLLNSYYSLLDRSQIEALGPDLLCLRTPHDIEMASAVPAAQIAYTRRLAGSAFADLLLRWPAALRGIASVVPETYRFFRPLLGERAWEFFSRDPAEIAGLAEGDVDRLAAFGPYLADVSPAAVQAFDRMSLVRVQVFLGAFKRMFGEDAAILLSDPAFCRQSLTGMVRSFAAFDGNDDELGGLVELKCAAIAPAVQAYLAKRRAGAPPA